MARKFIKTDTGYRPNAPQEILDKTLDELNMHEDTKAKLKSAELNTVCDIASCEMRSLYKIDKMTKRDVFSVLRAIKSLNLDFKPVERKAEPTADGAPSAPQQQTRPQPNRERGNNNNRRPQERNANDKFNRGNKAQADPNSAPMPMERQKVNTRDYDANGNRRRNVRDTRDNRGDNNNHDTRDNRNDGNSTRRSSTIKAKPQPIKLPPLKIADGLYKFYKAGKWGYKNETGDIAIEPQYDEAFNFSEGYAGVELGEKVGFIDTSGNVVIPMIYDSVTSFSEGVASVTLDDKCAYIDKEGNEVYGFIFEAATAFNNNIALVKKDGKWGYMDRVTGDIRLR